ncbi:MAG: diguanylate cyclase [Eubacteriales bacterium]|nr:diguanylate cyclase [Eubacteriales bacterium]
MDKRDTLLIASDSDTERMALRELFQHYYHLLEANNTEQAALLLHQNHSIVSCVLLSVERDPSAAGELLRSLCTKGEEGEIPVILLLPADIDDETMIVLDTYSTAILRKPYPDRVLLHRVRTLLALYQRHAALQKQLEDKERQLRYSNSQMIDALSNIIEQRSLGAGQHIQRIRGFTRILLEEIAASWPEYGLDAHKIDQMSSAAVLHDIGKISIPDEILNKPGYLTKSEFEVMQTHTTNGCQILAQLRSVVDEEYLRYAYNICRYHHERWDGRGYPDGLRKDEIPICAQAAAVADVYDALTNDRVYKAAYHSDRAATMILNGECGAFSPKVLESFKACASRFAELERYYKEEATAEYPVPATPILSSESIAVGSSAADRLQAKHQALLYYQNATVLEADLITGVFQLLYNPNPDYRVPKGTMSFFAFANQVANEQIHPDDRERYLAEVNHCHNALFEQGQRKHSVCARMKGVATRRYRPYMFSTIRIDAEDPNSRDVLLVCRPLDERAPINCAPGQTRLQADPHLQTVLLCNTLFIRHDIDLSIIGGIGILWELTGYSKQEIDVQFGGSLLELVHPSDRTRVLRRIRDQLAFGTTVDLDFRINTKLNGDVWVLGRASLYTDQNGEEYFCVFLQDDSNSHNVLDRLQQAADYRDIFLRRSSDITFIWDMVAKQFTVDEKWEQRFGHDPCDAQFADTLEGAHHLHPDDVPTMYAFFDKLRAGEPYAEADVRILRVRGGYLWSRFRAGVLLDSDGTPLRAVGDILDIDSLKREGTVADISFQQRIVDAWSGASLDAETRQAFFTYMFRRFQQAQDLDAELHRALVTICQAAGAGRVYFYEIDPSHQECRRAFDHYETDVPPLTTEQEALHYTMGYAAWLDRFDEHGILCIPDTSYLSGPERAVTHELGVQAVLQYRIEEDGQLYGFVGLDDYRSPRIWTTEQVEGFRTFMQIVSLFLIKARAIARGRQHEEELATILNHQDIWAYVIDSDHCLQFLNEKMRALTPAGRSKQRCYEVFMRRGSPCPGCPAFALKDGVTTASADIENPYLNLRMRVTATAIRWEGRDAVFIRCTEQRNALLTDAAPQPNPFKSVLHPDVLAHTGCVDRSDPELMLAALQTLMDHLPGMLFVKDLDLTYRASNLAFAQMTGKHAAHEVVGKPDKAVFTDNKLITRYTADDRKLLIGGRDLVDYIEPSTDENGEARYNSTSKYILTSENGIPVGLLGISQDITKEIRSRYRYEKEVDYLFTLPRDVFVARLIDIDDWRIIGQRSKPIKGYDLPAYDSVDHMLADIKRGLCDASAQDALYFYEEFSPTLLRNLHNSGRSQIEMEHLFYFPNGESAWVRNEIKFLTDPADGHRCLMLVVRDIDSERRTADEMIKTASTDALTGVLTRGAGFKQFEEFLRTEGKNDTHAVFMIDVDNFKSVNDLFGHPVGDKLLCDLADAIRSCFREDDFIIRMGGDEFLVCAKRMPTNRAVQDKVDELLQAVRRVRAANTEAMVSTSIGISLYPENGATPIELFTRADEALYRAKKSGKNRAAFASDEHVLYEGSTFAMRYEDYNSLVTDHAGLFCYIADLETHELLHLDQTMMDAYGIASPEGYQGRKCYTVLHGRSEPCAFCNNDTLQEGRPCECTYYNAFLGKQMHATDRKLHINGRWCRLEIARPTNDAPDAPDVPPDAPDTPTDAPDVPTDAPDAPDVPPDGGAPV